jgi:hypothetical protein
VRFDALSDRARRFLSKRLNYRECFLGPDGELTKQGAAVMRDLARKSGIYQELSHKAVAGAIDPLAMARAEGRRDMYRFIQARLELPDRAVLEAMEDET